MKTRIAQGAFIYRPDQEEGEEKSVKSFNRFRDARLADSLIKSLRQHGRIKVETMQMKDSPYQNWIEGGTDPDSWIMTWSVTLAIDDEEGEEVEGERPE